MTSTIGCSTELLAGSQMGNSLLSFWNDPLTASSFDNVQPHQLSTELDAVQSTEHLESSDDKLRQFSESKKTYQRIILGGDSSPPLTPQRKDMEKKTQVLLFGGIIIDRYFEIENYPEHGRNAAILDSTDKVGGCAINVAVTLQNLGVVPYVVSKLGDDENGRFIMRYVQLLGLPTECITIENNRSTGYCLAIIDKKGESTFFTSKGCENKFSPGVLPDKLCQKITFAYVTGYYLVENDTASSVLEFLKKLKNAGCRILFDPGPLVAYLSVSQLSTMLSLADVIVPNMHELELIRDKLALPCDLYHWLHEQGCKYIIVKKGAEGVEVHTPEENMFTGAFLMNSIDTTGAGDSFAGGLIYALAHEFELHNAIELASACGAFTTTIKGPHGFFSIEDIYNVIKTQKKSL